MFNNFIEHLLLLKFEGSALGRKLKIAFVKPNVKATFSKGPKLNLLY